MKKAARLHENIGWVVAGMVILGTLPAAISLTYYYLHFEGPLSISNATWSQFGEFVGGTVGPSLSFAALLGLAVTLWSQSLSYRQTAASLEEERKSARRRDFERTLFEMLHLYNDMVRSVDLRRLGGLGAENASSVIAQGRDCFKNFYESFSKKYTTTRKGYGGDSFKEAAAAVTGCEIQLPDMPPELQLIREAYKDVFNDIQQDVGHCFRLLYRIVKFIDDENSKENGVISKSARTYGGLVRAQLSTYECALLFYNGLSNVGEKFKPLIESYALLGNLDLDILVKPAHKSLYDEHAFA